VLGREDLAHLPQICWRRTKGNKLRNEISMSEESVDETPSETSVETASFFTPPLSRCESMLNLWILPLFLTERKTLVVLREDLFDILSTARETRAGTLSKYVERVS